jgi:hypothetical protein
MDPSQIPDAYHETRADLENATTPEEVAACQKRLAELNARIDEEDLDELFEGYPPRYNAPVPMEEEPENLDPEEYVTRTTQIEEILNREQDPIRRRELLDERDRIYEEAERQDLTGL